jgi:4-hydroxy-tetrahydrodipicolinate synthase
MAITFRGAYTAITTPFTSDGSSLDLAKLREQLAFQAQGGVTGVIVAGTTGESPTLSEAEYQTLLSAAVEIGRPLGLQVIAGTGSNSTAHAVHLQKLAQRAGADAALSVNPYYNKPGQEGLYRHFVTQADASELPVMLYNIPGRTGVALAPETVERLAVHPKIRAIKEATGSTDSCGEIALRCPNLAVLSGDDTMTLPFASVGAVGVVSVVSNLFPEKIAGLCRLFLAGDFAGALKVHRELIPIARAMFVETNPIPVKAAMKLLGRDSGALRLPMTEARPETIATLKKTLKLPG